MVRFKNRWIAVDVVGQPLSSIQLGDVFDSLKSTILAMFDDIGYGLTIPNLKIVYSDPITNLLIIKCGMAGHEYVEKAIDAITCVDSKPLKLNSVRKSATINAIKKYSTERFAEWAVMLTNKGKKEDVGELMNMIHKLDQHLQ